MQKQNRERAISVIVPAYNAASTIAACIESLKRQTRRAEEIIVVDDASSDATACVAAAAGARVIRLETNCGPGVARNAGAEAARGTILAFTDSDCVAPEDWLERIAAALDEPGVVAATGGYAGPVRDSFLTRLQHLALRERQAALPEHIESTITSNFACLASAFAAVGGFPVYYRLTRPLAPVWGNEDEELGFLLAKKGRIRWLRDAGVFHLFRLRLGGYLRQQAFYAERIVMSHFRFPEMARSQSNYSRLSGALHLGSISGAALGLAIFAAAPAEMEIVETAGALLAAVAGPLYLALPLATLRRLRQAGESIAFAAKAYFVLLAVDVAWLCGAVKGVLSSLEGFIDGNRQSAAASAAARQ